VPRIEDAGAVITASTAIAMRVMVPGPIFAVVVEGLESGCVLLCLFCLVEDEKLSVCLQSPRQKGSLQSSKAGCFCVLKRASFS